MNVATPIISVQDLMERFHLWKIETEQDYVSAVKVLRMFVEVEVKELGRERGERRAARLALEVKRNRDLINTTTAVESSGGDTQQQVAAAFSPQVHPFVHKLYARSANLAGYQAEQHYLKKVRTGEEREEDLRKTNLVTEKAKRSTGTYEALVTEVLKEDNRLIEEERAMYRPGGKYDSKSRQEEAQRALKGEQERMNQLEIQIAKAEVKRKQDAEFEAELAANLAESDRQFEKAQNDLRELHSNNSDLVPGCTERVAALSSAHEAQVQTSYAALLAEYGPIPSQPDPPYQS